MGRPERVAERDPEEHASDAVASCRSQGCAPFRFLVNKPGGRGLTPAVRRAHAQPVAEFGQLHDVIHRRMSILKGWAARPARPRNVGAGMPLLGRLVLLAPCTDTTNTCCSTTCYGRN